jgi:uncharacterized membrane protein YhaH (DUF805 family)
MKIRAVLFSVSGRIPRQTYWLAMLGIFAVSLLSSFIVEQSVGAPGVSHRGSSPPALLMLLSALVQPFLIWCTLAVNIKRWHDRGKSGYWVLIGLIPLLGPFWSVIELGFLEGTQGANEFDQGHFARDVLLDDDDPLHSMPQIAGRSCAQCRQKIVSFIGAALCPECHEPLHDECRREHVSGVHRAPARAAYPG